MGKTYKDKANHFMHHMKPANDFTMKKSKYKYEKTDVPDDIKDMVQTLEYSYAGSRHGNHRKMYAKMKVDENHSQRMKDKQNFRKELKEE